MLFFELMVKTVPRFISISIELPFFYFRIYQIKKTSKLMVKILFQKREKQNKKLECIKDIYINKQISMYIKTYNKSLSEQSRKALQFAFVKETNPQDDETYFCNDTDGVKYRVLAKSKIVRLYLIATDIKVVWNYCHEHFKNKYYKNFKVRLVDLGKLQQEFKANLQHGDAVEIILDQQALTIWNQTYAAKQQTGIITGKKKFDALFDYLSKKFASVKRHFFASPFEMMLQTISQNAKNKGSTMLPNLCYNVHSSEKVWIAFEKNQMTVYFGVSFEDRFQQQLCKILFSQFIDAQKHVRNPPSVKLLDAENSKTMTDSFPQQKSKKYTFSNGIIAFKIFGGLVSKPQSVATFLCNFRNYVYYHIQAQKCYLHSRVLRRITTIQNDLNHTKIEPFALN